MKVAKKWKLEQHQPQFKEHMVVTAASPVPIKGGDCEHPRKSEHSKDTELAEHPQKPRYPLKRGGISHTLLNADPNENETPGSKNKFYRVQVTDYEPGPNDYDY
ncbi:hypothetical protein E3P92_03996 [Wallemia ichthyophaga]|uniref:Uncharacterized protein n=2 Tax=Wallemia ichthyophaga TaxID=245174 RepID=A0A4T0HYR5_WALIC|nr:uncharacterized protein J056_000799 [Wallemia ichthyophaga EXF-994]TIA94843.1 hypothetical protein E3P95_04031 [Wallemia ichthyophaga]EOR00601.1 hypothetical protein J056_000799 [Wallemia ichthyophaga EXF-994]TIA95531.1 hypothetical protein E3P94_04022 [Wallemia ichthyophaga]TIB07145.1 hypothetical protein E3P93_03996 [Wallemia ichthyophaga]TIB07591.1 hypothetical protein E3P92_03996 [Wallemia ichthyophaga]